MIIFREDTDNDRDEDKPLLFQCWECGNRFRMTQWQDPTTSHGGCATCGGARWCIKVAKTGEIIS